MTVGELIEALSNFDLDLEVGVAASRTNGILTVVDVEFTESDNDNYVLVDTE